MVSTKDNIQYAVRDVIINILIGVIGVLLGIGVTQLSVVKTVAQNEQRIFNNEVHIKSNKVQMDKLIELQTASVSLHREIINQNSILIEKLSK